MNEAEPSANLSALAKRVPGIAQSIALSALFFGVAIAVTNALQLLQQFANVSLDIYSSHLIQKVIAWPLTIWVGLRWSRVSFREACPLTRFPVRIVPALLIASCGVTILLLAAETLIPVPEALQNPIAQRIAYSSRLTVFLSGVLVAPLAEELFFRGWVLRGYLGRYSFTKAVWASTVLFALFHLDPWQVVVALPFGLGFVWLFLRTGSLAPGILSHITANFTADFLLFPLARALGYDTQTLKASGHYPLSILAIGGAMAGIGGFILWRQLTKLPK